jgi:hypothetical protein
MKLIMDVDEPLTEQEQVDLRYLFADALWDFRCARKGDYVETRYAEQEEWFREKKRKDVERRVALATKLHNAALTVIVERTPDEK